LTDDRRIGDSVALKIMFRFALPWPDAGLTYFGSVDHPLRRIFSRSGSSKLGPAFKNFRGCF
jgi:hypothetical protein